jgi:enoyl-CoA hydratase
MDRKNLLIEKKDKVAFLTFNRPQRMNALNRETILELKEAVESLAGDDSIRILILTGMGEKAFVAGADIEELSAINPLQALKTATLGSEAFALIENLGKPSIAAVNGYALGGGCELAMACTIRLASENALFGFPEVGIGTIPGYGGTQRLPRLVGKGKAMELLLTGDPVDAREAHRIGLVNRVTTRKDLLPLAEKMALRILKNAPMAVELALRVVNKGGDVPLSHGNYMESLTTALLRSTKDMEEGTKAFLGKRVPEFAGE